MCRLKPLAIMTMICVFLLATPKAGKADKLEDVLEAGVLRCAVVLDFPPIGYLDAKNQPAGFDVEYGKDLAKVLGVDYKILAVTWAGRLPAIVNNKADVVFGGTSDTLERAKIVGFTIPYAIYYFQAIVGKDSGIKRFEDLKGKRVAIAAGTTTEKEFLKYARKWGTEHLYQGHKSENDVFLAVAQGKADAGITTNTAIKSITERYDTVIAGPKIPRTIDYTSVVGPRKDVSWLNYLNLFITHQVRSGRYEELWMKYVGSKAPELRVPGVHY